MPGFIGPFTDYGPMVHIENINGLHHAIGLHIVEKTEPMTGAEFRFLRKQMQFSQAELGRIMNVTDQTVANYEKGKTAIGPAETLIRTLYLLDILPEETRVKMIKRLIDLRQKLPDKRRAAASGDEAMAETKRETFHG